MSKNTKINGKPKLNKHPIHRLITVEEFLKRVKKDPNSIYEDFDVKYAIEKLSNAYLPDNSEWKNKAKQILQKAGLKAYIPKDSKSKLKKYKHNPTRLIQEVDTLSCILNESLPKRGRKPEEIEKAIRELDKEGRLTDEDLENPEWDWRTSRNMAIGYIAIVNNLKFKTVFNFYYNCKKSVKESIKRIKENPNSLDVNPKSFLHNYNQAYNDYLIKEHKTHEYHEIAKRLQEALLPAHKALADVSKGIEEAFKPLRETLSKIDFPNIQYLNFKPTKNPKN